MARHHAEEGQAVAGTGEVGEEQVGVDVVGGREHERGFGAVDRFDVFGKAGAGLRERHDRAVVAQDGEGARFEGEHGKLEPLADLQVAGMGAMGVERSGADHRGADDLIAGERLAQGGEVGGDAVSARGRFACDEQGAIGSADDPIFFDTGNDGGHILGAGHEVGTLAHGRLSTGSLLETKKQVGKAYCAGVPSGGAHTEKRHRRIPAMRVRRWRRRGALGGGTTCRPRRLSGPRRIFCPRWRAGRTACRS